MGGGREGKKEKANEHTESHQKLCRQKSVLTWPIKHKVHEEE